MNSISIYSDLICPWCYIGKRRMEEALRQLPGDTQVSRSWHPFQLNPEMPRAVKPEMYRSKKFGSWERVAGEDAQVTAAGKSVGLSSARFANAYAEYVRLAPARLARGNFRPARFRGRGFVALTFAKGSTLPTEKAN